MWEKELEKEKGKVTSKKRNLDVAEDAEQEGPSTEKEEVPWCSRKNKGRN